MSRPPAASAGDRAVAIAGFLAILLTGFFGADPDERPGPAPAQHGASQPVPHDLLVGGRRELPPGD